MKVNKKNLQVIDKEISYTHIETGSKTICFMFSGSGYNYDKPLFYYATMNMLQNNIDIVHIHYSYGDNFFKKSIEEISNAMMDDINPVILDVLKDGEYNETIFLGKSLGTIPIAIDLLKRESFLNSKIILLTPLFQINTIFDSILHCEHQGLVVIGDYDPHFNESQIEKLSSSNLMIEVIQNANHSLDIGEFEATNSILALSGVIEKIQKVIIAN